MLHELCHLKRHDLLVDWLCTLLNVIHWFNPLLWLAAARFRADRELARDAMVLRLTGSDESRSYGLTLLRLAETIHRPGRRPILAPLLAGRTRLVERIHMIARFDARRPRFSIAGLGLLLVVGCSTLSRPKPASEQSAAQTPSSSVGGVHAAQTALSMTTQVYDIRDLINDIPDFDDAPSMALSASAAATRPAPTTKSALPLSRQQAVQHVIVLIRETIDPDSW